MIEQIKMLREAHKAFNTVTNNTPTIVDDKTALLRAKLNTGENSELVGAMADENIVEIFDGILDVLYVAFGTADTYGLSDFLVQGFEQVHKNNMTKLGKDGKPILDKSGKWVKPDDYKPVDLSWIKHILSCFGEPAQENAICNACDLMPSCVDKMSKDVEERYNTIKPDCFRDRDCNDGMHAMEKCRTCKVKIECEKGLNLR